MIVIYDLMENIPHYLLLSFICAELSVRFAYDSIYVSIKKKRSLWSTANIEPDEFVFAKSYVTKLFRSNLRSNGLINPSDINRDRLNDFQSESGLQRKMNLSRLKRFFTLISFENDYFRLTTVGACTYTVAMLFLYYFSCTLVFHYIIIATDSTSSIRSYLETIFNIGKTIFFTGKSTNSFFCDWIEFEGFVPLRPSIIVLS